MIGRPDPREATAAGLALFVGVGALRGTGSMSNLGSVFPTTAASVMIIAALAVLLRSSLRAGRRAGAGGAVREAGPPGTVPRFVGASIALVAWALALKPLGFLASGAIGLLAFGLLAWREPMSVRAVATHLAAGAIMLVGFYVLMAEVLRLAVP